MKKKVFFAAALLGLSLLTACGSQKKAESSAAGDSSAAGSSAAGSSEAGSSAAAASGDKVITVGASPSPHAEILAAAKDALKAEGYELKVVEYTDYVQPNLALESKSLDANYFQHLPYLENFNKERGTKLVSAAAIHYEPFGIYAGKSKDLKNIQDGAKIAVPNDVTNEARALLLLADQGLIKLKVENPHKIEIVEVEAAQVPRSLPDVDFGVINGNFAIAAGLKVSDALAAESADSVAAKTYANIIAVREGDENSDKTKALVKALTTAEIKQFIENKYQGAVVPIF